MSIPSRGTMRLVVAGALLAFACAPAAAQPGPSEIRLITVAQGLTQPVDLTHDGTERLFIVEQPGRVRVLANKVLRNQAYLDITDRVHSGGECGLLGLAFHPQFASNGLFYVNYTTRRPRLRTIVSEFRAEPGSFTVDPSTERVVLSFDQPFPNHNGGQVAFGPDGMLYIATGDGGSANDPQDNGQRLDTLLGKILRIDVTPADGYAVPQDNPFVGNEDARPEIWAYGLRNPWRFSFDSKTSVMYSGDVGQNLYEEIDIIVRGGNYGWRHREGLHQFQRGREDEQFIDPIAEYEHSLGLSVTGGFVYRGTASPVLEGIYLYGDYSSGRVWGLRYEDGQVTWNEQINVTAGGRRARNLLITSFGQDVNGELYLCSHSGAAYRIVAD